MVDSNAAQLTVFTSMGAMEIYPFSPDVECHLSHVRDAPKFILFAFVSLRSIFLP